MPAEMGEGRESGVGQGPMDKGGKYFFTIVLFANTKVFIIIIFYVIFNCFLVFFPDFLEKPIKLVELISTYVKNACNRRIYSI